jgi:serine phosphatase RsbU (regulator of sigma subunit)
MGVLFNLGLVSTDLGWKRFDDLTDPINVGVFPVEISDVGSVVFLVAIGIVMFFRFTRVSRDQARSAAELAAAREIQQRLVPATLPDVPGYRIETAYLPAQEVGGDFYQVLPQSDGATLIVVGDVSGKGLKAAMTGTLAIGALRTLGGEGLQPGLLLARLNREMVRAQDGGFITCLCALVDPDGAVVLANAGHLSPYRSGKEVPVDSGLPLGITDAAAYTETTIQLGAGDMLTLISDGVLEARNAAGELFGFERTAALSDQPAETIAQRAQHFGQEDDITVLTVTRVAMS